MFVGIIETLTTGQLLVRGVGQRSLYLYHKPGIAHSIQNPHIVLLKFTQNSGTRISKNVNKEADNQLPLLFFSRTPFFCYSAYVIVWN